MVEISLEASHIKQTKKTQNEIVVQSIYTTFGMCGGLNKNDPDWLSYLNT